MGEDRGVTDKRIVIIEPDGTERRLGVEIDDKGGILNLPTLAETKKIVGGHIEMVRVLREDLPGIQHTYMIVNEDGLIDGLPRNQKATDLYLANVRRQFPDATDPSKAAAAAYRRHWEALGATVIDRNPPGYDDDPYIAGTVIWFDGWTCDEFLEAGL